METATVECAVLEHAAKMVKYALTGCVNWSNQIPFELFLEANLSIYPAEELLSLIPIAVPRAHVSAVSHMVEARNGQEERRAHATIMQSEHRQTYLPSVAASRSLKLSGTGLLRW